MTVEELALQTVALEGRIEHHEARLNDIEKRQDNLDALAKSVALVAQEQEHIKTDVQKIDANVQTLMDKPGKRWDSLVEKVVVGIVGVLIGYLGFKLGLSA